MKERAIEVSNLKKYFKDVNAVDDISFSVEQGELFGFLGVNGAGKSTLLKIIIGEMRADEGEVILSKGKTMGYLAQHQDQGKFADSRGTLWRD